MISRLIELSLKNRFLVLIAYALLGGWGYWALLRTPIDAIPDLSEDQVIVFTDWPGRSPQDVEDQITYPLTVNLQGLASVRTVRSSSAFGFSMINIIFEDDVDVYFARTRVLERLNLASSFLPAGVVPTLGPDATGVGQVFWYTVDGPYDPGTLRSLQDWFIRYQLNSVGGVAEVASIGGFVRQYQIDVDPVKLRAFNIPVRTVFEAVERSNNNVGAKVIEATNMEYVVRGLGLIESVKDIEDIVHRLDQSKSSNDILHVGRFDDLRADIVIAALDGFEYRPDRNVEGAQLHRVDVDLILPDEPADARDLRNTPNGVELISNKPILKRPKRAWIVGTVNRVPEDLANAGGVRSERGHNTRGKKAGRQVQSFE